MKQFFSTYIQSDQYEAELPQLNIFRIIQNVIETIDIKKVELHNFADASEMTYGACIYIRNADSEGNHHTNLVCARSRVSPLKNLSASKARIMCDIVATQLAHKVST